ncbi:MAG: DedA family protein [Phycisphaeraceae bacterium]
MEEWLTQFAANAPYVVVFGVLVLSGFGLPLPEDIPLLLAGYLAGQGYADPWIMFPGCFLAIVGADLMVFTIGRRYGHYVPRLPLLRGFLTEARLARTERQLHRHGGKFIFMARFLPGVRTAAYFTAGTFKIPYWKFLLFDGSAAAISVPAIVFLAYFFAHEIDRVREWVQEGQIAAIILVVLVIVVLAAIKLFFKRRTQLADPDTPPSLHPATPPTNPPRTEPRGIKELGD